MCRRPGGTVVGSATTRGKCQRDGETSDCGGTTHHSPLAGFCRAHQSSGNQVPAAELRKYLNVQAGNAAHHNPPSLNGARYITDIVAPSSESQWMARCRSRPHVRSGYGAFWRSSSFPDADGTPKSSVRIECPQPRSPFCRLQIVVTLPRGRIDARLKALAWRRTGCGAARSIQQRIGLYGG